MKGHSRGSKAAVAFGAGLLLSCVCPPEWLVTILAIALVITGLVFAK